MACKIHGPTCSGDHADPAGHPLHQGQNPFNTPRPNNATPYWLRNGVADYEYIANAEREHRKRMGMDAGKVLLQLSEERAVVDALLMDIAANKLSAPQALAHLNEWRRKHDNT